MLPIILLPRKKGTAFSLGGALWKHLGEHFGNTWGSTLETLGGELRSSHLEGGIACRIDSRIAA